MGKLARNGLKTDARIPKKLVLFASMKNAFCFICKALFVRKTFKFLSWLCWSCRERLDKKAKVNFKICDVINLEINTIHVLPKSQEILENHAENEAGRLVPDFFLFFFKNFIHSFLFISIVIVFFKISHLSAYKICSDGPSI